MLLSFFFYITGKKKGFGKKDKQFINILASASSVIIKNQQIYEKSIHSLRKSNVLLEVARYLNSETDLTSLIGLMMREVILSVKREML